ncbi:pirin family protein [Nocardioides mangrovi]|uniref:Pirin family protein n=1 Tax=Nocardioides mangrovi TaxID=2874580 RepID=A0ABS7UBP0_9ACTN|nr:pirin family protein [Nocardioides mangrovi]MBZ5738072.1 pirin family protein [Nocardioides mangrovi]
MAVEIRRGTDRYLTRGEGYFTRHSFAFGGHYDPENVRFGRLVCHDDHRLKAGAGFPDHEHRDVEIVTWVLSGSLEHSDSEGHTATVRPGEVQVLSAGSGVTHAEVAGPEGQVRFVQAWLTPEEPGTTPAYDVRPVSLEPGALTEVVTLGDATLLVARLDAGQTVTLPDAPLQHVFVAGGALTRSSLAEPLADGDAFRITDEPGHEVTAAVPTQLMVWTFR